MFEILVYLFETYYSAELTPDKDDLTQRLSQAGFENEEISEALDWLGELNAADDRRVVTPRLAESGGFRAYTRSEMAKLSREARGFLTFLESAGMLTPPLRELIIERTLAVDAEPVPLDEFKVIVLMVLWTRQGNLDSLVLEELLPDGEAHQMH